jgi:hypothetical protein
LDAGRSSVIVGPDDLLDVPVSASFGIREGAEVWFHRLQGYHTKVVVGKRVCDDERACDGVSAKVGRCMRSVAAVVLIVCVMEPVCMPFSLGEDRATKLAKVK